jgi:membrane protease YdiL (CAAX protease family)
MKSRAAVVTVVLAFVFILVMVVNGFDTSPPRSEHSQSVRMYLVFAAYLSLLFGVRALLKKQAPKSSVGKGWRMLKLTVGSLSIGGGVYILGIVLSLVLGGADMVGAAILPLLYAAPAVAILVLPFLSKHMT